jgi:hypothetical protein
MLARHAVESAADKAMPCTEVAVYLLHTLHSHFDQPLMISAEGADPAVSRSLGTTLSDAGFRNVFRVGFITEPPKVHGGAR